MIIVQYLDNQYHCLAYTWVLVCENLLKMNTGSLGLLLFILPHFSLIHPEVVQV